MPRYVYKAKENGCNYCKDGFEVSHSAQSPAFEKCPRCKAQIERIIFAVSTLKSGGKKKQEPSSEDKKKIETVEHKCSDHCGHSVTKK